MLHPGGQLRSGASRKERVIGGSLRSGGRGAPGTAGFRLDLAQQPALLDRVVG